MHGSPRPVRLSWITSDRVLHVVREVELSCYLYYIRNRCGSPRILYWGAAGTKYAAEPASGPLRPGWRAVSRPSENCSRCFLQQAVAARSQAHCHDSPAIRTVGTKGMFQRKRRGAQPLHPYRSFWGEPIRHRTGGKWQRFGYRRREMGMRTKRNAGNSDPFSASTGPKMLTKMLTERAQNTPNFGQFSIFLLA